LALYIILQILLSRENLFRDKNNWKLVGSTR
jgi:hypothetical protein